VKSEVDWSGLDNEGKYLVMENRQVKIIEGEKCYTEASTLSMIVFLESGQQKSFYGALEPWVTLKNHSIKWFF